LTCFVPPMPTDRKGGGWPTNGNGTTLSCIVLREVLVMAGPGDEIAAGAGGRGHLRASHADRQQVIGTLKAAFVQGMLAKDEFDQRVGQAFASRTYADLAALTADLPAMPAAAQPPKPARAQGEQPVLRPGPVIMVATALYAGVWPFLVSWPKNSEGDTPAPVGLLFSSTTTIYVVVLVVAVGYVIAGWREKRSGGQLPRGQAPGAGSPASWRLPPAGPGGQLPPTDPGHRQTAEAARRRRPRPPLPVRGHVAGGALAAGTAPASG
jgi:Domain of unknown function (DUF1707)